MKKLISIGLAAVLTLGMAVTAFATNTEQDMSATARMERFIAARDESVAFTLAEIEANIELFKRYRRTQVSSPSSFTARDGSIWFSLTHIDYFNGDWTRHNQVVEEFSESQRTGRIFTNELDRRRIERTNNPGNFYDVIETHSDSTMTIRTNTDELVRVAYSQQAPNGEIGIRIETGHPTARHALLSHTVPTPRGVVFNISQVTSSDEYNYEIIKDLGNFTTLQESATLSLFDIPKGHYKITLLHAPEGYQKLEGHSIRFVDTEYSHDTGIIVIRRNIAHFGVEPSVR